MSDNRQLLLARFQATLVLSYKGDALLDLGQHINRQGHAFFRRDHLLLCVFVGPEKYPYIKVVLVAVLSRGETHLLGIGFAKRMNTLFSHGYSPFLGIQKGRLQLAYTTILNIVQEIFDINE